MVTTLISLLVLQQDVPRVSLASDQKSLSIARMLAVPAVGRGGRTLFTVDPVQAEIVSGDWHAPSEGTEIAPNRTWKAREADKDGWFRGPGFQGGYAFAEVDSEADRVMLLDATGDGMVYVNGEPFPGDPYSYGWLQFPVMLRKGANQLLFLTGRGRMKAQFDAPKSAVVINAGDPTLPDAVVGTETSAKFGGIVLENASEKEMHGISVRAGLPGAEPAVTRVPDLAPLSALKVRFDIPQAKWTQAQEVDLNLDVLKGEMVLDSSKLRFRVRTAVQTRKETYISPVDDSVQYYAVVPPPVPKPRLGMLLSLHGAGVEAIGQADAYSPKDWAYVVCATNRRPYGFDWEDWGREDGLDVLSIAEREYKTDPSHTYVTGHSMGGHGTWQFGALFPDRWAAIGVSAGWASFFSYVGVPRSSSPTPLGDILQRSCATSNTLDLEHNFADEGVYILHGDADDNVPVTEARNMKAALSAFDSDLGYHEQPGAGHWWSTPLTKGASCLEWPDMMSFLQAHKLEGPKKVDFTSVDLNVSPSYHGIRILEQSHPLEPSRIQIGLVGDMGPTLAVTTSNIDRVYLPPLWNRSGALVFDGQSVASSTGYYAKVDGKWQPDKAGQLAQVGPFKEVFNNHCVLVYGTAGTPEENAWAYARARFDSEAFWYRGNGALKIVPDRQYLRGRHSSANVILYGNADTNAAWSRVMGAAPISVRRGQIQIGKHVENGSDLACVFCWKKPGDGKLNGAVSGSGLAGMRLTDRIPYFVSGVGLPDWLLDSPDTLKEPGQGVLGAGFFGPDGSVEAGDHVFR